MQNTYQNGPKEGAPTERFFEWAHAFGKPQRQPLCSSGSNEVVRITDNLQTNPAAHVSVFSDIGPSSEFRAWSTVIAGFLYKQARKSELGPKIKLGIPSLVHSLCRVSTGTQFLQGFSRISMMWIADSATSTFFDLHKACRCQTF